MSLNLDNITDIAIIVGISLGAGAVFKFAAPKLMDFGGSKIDEILDSPKFINAVHKHTATSPAMIEMAGAVTSVADAVTKMAKASEKASKANA